MQQLSCQKPPCHYAQTVANRNFLMQSAQTADSITEKKSKKQKSKKQRKNNS